MFSYDKIQQFFTVTGASKNTLETCLLIDVKKYRPF